MKIEFYFVGKKEKGLDLKEFSEFLKWCQYYKYDFFIENRESDNITKEDNDEFFLDHLIFLDPEDFNVRINKNTKNIKKVLVLNDELKYTDKVDFIFLLGPLAEKRPSEEALKECFAVNSFNSIKESVISLKYLIELS